MKTVLPFRSRSRIDNFDIYSSIVGGVLSRASRMPRIAISWLFLLAGCVSMAGISAEQYRIWNTPVKPFRIIGNIYYVGASDLTSFLIATPQGHILLDGGLPGTATQIEQNVAALGFRMRDVKILLNSHAHFDHAGGLAELKRVSGGRMAASRQDAPALM